MKGNKVANINYGKYSTTFQRRQMYDQMIMNGNKEPNNNDVKKYQTKMTWKSIKQ